MMSSPMLPPFFWSHKKSPKDGAVMSFLLTFKTTNRVDDKMPQKEVTWQHQKSSRMSHKSGI